MARFRSETASVVCAPLRCCAFIAALYDFQASREGVVASADRLGSFSTLGSDSPARVRNRFTIWPSALKTSSFLAADACSSSRRSPVRQFLARKLNTYWLPRLVMEPSTTAALPVRSPISGATTRGHVLSRARGHQN